MKTFFRASNVVLLLLCAMYFITYLDRVNVSTAAAGFSMDFGLSKTQIGLVFSAFAYPYLVCQVIGGGFGDRFGNRLVWGKHQEPNEETDPRHQREADEDEVGDGRKKEGGQLAAR